MDFKLFISYSSKDKEKIQPILSILKTIQEVKIFFAEKSLMPGAIIDLTIKNAISQCDLFVLFQSINSTQSTYVQQEIGVALATNKIVVPILLDETKPPAMLNGINYLDISNQEKYQLELNRLYNYLIANIQRKKQNQALAILGLLGLGYLLLREEEK